MSTGNITVTQGACLLLSTLLGSGVLIIPALAASTSGIYSLAAWVLIILAMLPIVVTFAALGKRFPHEGGTAYYVKQAFGDNAAKAIGILYIAIAPIGPPVVFIAGASYFAQFLGNSSLDAIYFELGMLLLIFIANCLKIETSAKLQTYISFGLIITILAICFLAILEPTSVSSTTMNAVANTAANNVNSTVNSTAANMANFSLVDIGKSVAIMFWCFVGIEAICHIAKDFNDPARDFPKVVVIGVAVAALIYVVVSYSVIKLGAYGSELQNLQSITTVASISAGVWGAKIVALVGFLGCFCGVNVYVISFAKMLYSMGDKTSNLKRKLGNGTPIVAVSIITVAIAAMLFARASLSFSFEVLLDYANGMFVFIYLAAAAAGIKLLTGKIRYAAIFSLLFCLAILWFIGVSTLFGLSIVLGSFCLFRFRDRVEPVEYDVS
ncbi:MAG: amino acid efflux transporter [Moritella sp.]|jgi:amino acid efflux transporter